MALTANQSEASIAHNIVELSPDVNVERFKIDWGCSRDTALDLTHTNVQTEKHGLVQVVMRNGQQREISPRT